MAILEERVEAWETASNLVQPIVVEHGIEQIRNGAPFGQGYTSTKVEQHIEQILRVSNWLLGIDQ